MDWYASFAVCACHLQEEMRQSVAPAEPVQYYFTLAQQPGAVQVQGTQQAQQPGAQTATTIQPGQIIIAQPQQGQVLLTALFEELFHWVCPNGNLWGWKLKPTRKCQKL